MAFWPSAWVYPGGHIEVGEGLDEGSLREFYEETGVKIVTEKIEGSAERKYTYANHQITVTPFYAFESQSAIDNTNPSQPKAPK